MGVASHWTANWAGYSVDGGTGFNGVQAAWTVQKNSSTAFSTPNDDDTWIGIGADHADVLDGTWSLIQAGTEMSSGSGFRSWFEFLCSPAPGCGTSVGIQYASGYGVSFTTQGSNANQVAAGDQMQGQVYWSGTIKACFDIGDTSRSTGSLYGCILGLVPYDPHSIEWIDEDAYSTSNVFMSNFTKTLWTSEESLSPSTGQAIAISTFHGDSNFSVVGNIAATDTNQNMVPPCSTTGVDAYPENISSANGGSSDTLWCAEGPPYPQKPQ